MKKLLSIIMLFFALFVIAGCNIITEATSITVKYETNGGSTIADQTIGLENIADFKLPDKPTREGYTFEGWYTNADLTEEFASITITSGSITLYAAWSEDGIDDGPIVVAGGDGIDATFTFGLDFEVTNETEVAETGTKETGTKETETNSLNADVTVNLVVEKLEVESLADLKAKVDVTVDIATTEESEATEPKQIAATLYISNSYVYISLPAMQINMKADLATIISAIEKVIAEFLPEATEDKTIEELIEDLVTEAKTYIEAAIVEAGLDKEVIIALLNEFKEVLAKLKPTVTVDGNTTIYAITKTQVADFFDAVEAFIEKNFETIYAMTESENEGNVGTVKVEGIGTFNYGEPGYWNLDNEFIEFQSMLEDYQTGLYDSKVGIYSCYFTGETFDTTTWKVLTEREVLEKKAAVYGISDYSGNYYKLGAAGWYTDEECTEANFHSFAEDTNSEHGYIDEYRNLYYCFYTNEYFNITTWQLVTEEELAQIELEVTKEKVLEQIKEVEEAITLNKLEATITTDDDKVLQGATFTLDVTGYSEYTEDNYSTSTDVKIAVEVVLTINSYEPTITFPTFGEEYIDQTETIVGYIGQLMESAEGKMPSLELK